MQSLMNAGCSESDRCFQQGSGSGVSDVSLMIKSQDLHCFIKIILPWTAQVRGDVFDYETITVLTEPFTKTNSLLVNALYLPRTIAIKNFVIVFNHNFLNLAKF